MASNVERVIDFLERQAANTDLPKILIEDLFWAIEVISANKLYSGNMDNINFNVERPEIKAWIDKIGLKDIPKNLEEMERLKTYEELMSAQKKKKDFGKIKVSVA